MIKYAKSDHKGKKILGWAMGSYSFINDICFKEPSSFDGKKPVLTKKIDGFENYQSRKMIFTLILLEIIGKIYNQLLSHSIATKYILYRLQTASLTDFV